MTDDEVRDDDPEPPDGFVMLNAYGDVAAVVAGSDFVLDPAVIADLAAERARQEARFPDQHLPSWTCWGKRERQAEAKLRVELAVGSGDLSWAMVLNEEVCEALDAAAMAASTRQESRDSFWVQELRGELIQVAAVCLRWVADIDRS